jgi:quercetin dioxygenase-like cupin family protein
MKSTPHLFTLALTLVTATAGVAITSPARAKPRAGDAFVQLPSAEMKWEEFYPGGPLESFVVGSKEAKHGPTGFFIKFKPGFDSGWHIHESEYAGVILAGTILETNKGSDAPKPLGPGSYYMQPKTVHKTECTAAAECLLWIFEEGKFSFTPTTEDGKPLPRPAPAAKKDAK